MLFNMKRNVKEELLWDGPSSMTHPPELLGDRSLRSGGWMGEFGPGKKGEVEAKVFSLFLTILLFLTDN